MFNKRFFDSQVWRRSLANFVITKRIPAPVISFTLVDGSSFNVKTLKALSHLIMLEVYGEEGETTMRFLPYKEIKSIELKAKEPEETRPMEFDLSTLKLKTRLY